MSLSFPLLETSLKNHQVAVPPTSKAPLAAVSIIFREQRKRLELLVIQRTRQSTDPWSGHLAFPGGREHYDDAGPLDTALRETKEEVSIDLTRDARMLGRLDWLSARPAQSGLLIAPFVFAVNKDVVIEPAPREVARYFWTDALELYQGDCDSSYSLTRGNARMQMPAYAIGGEHLWGLSYAMLQGLWTLVKHRAAEP